MAIINVREHFSRSGVSGSHGSDYTNKVMWYKDYAILTWASTFTCWVSEISLLKSP